MWTGLGTGGELLNGVLEIENLNLSALCPRKLCHWQRQQVHREGELADLGGSPKKGKWVAESRKCTGNPILLLNAI